MSRSGYLLLEAIIAIVIAGILATVFTTMNYYANIQSNTLKQQNTKIILEVLRSRLLHLAQDVDADSFFELLKEEADSTLPLSVGLGSDGWGKRIHYYTIDLGTLDITNTPYANTSTAISPNSNIAGRLVSSGSDMILETLSTHSQAQGDDLMIEIGVGELNHFKLYGGSEINAQTRAYNSAIISSTEPISPIHGTLWLDTSLAPSKLKVYDSATTNWVEVN